MSKIKVVKQRDLKDCGACCLSALISYYEGYVPIEQIRLDTATNNEGVKALNIITAAQKYGFESVGIRAQSLTDTNIYLPAIAHIITVNGLEHFVVVTKVNKNKVYVMDPAKGNVIFNSEDFNKIWTKVLILFYPKTRIINFVKTKTLLKAFGEILYQEKKLFLTIILTSLFLTIITIISSYYFKIAIDLITKQGDFRFLKIIILIFLTITMLKVVFSKIRKNLEIYLNKNIDCLLLANFMNHIFNLPLEVIRNRTSGEILTRVHDLVNIKNLITDIIISSLLDSFLMIISIPILYSINKTLFLVLLGMVLVYILIGLVFSKIIYKMAYNNLAKETALNSKIIEDVSMIQSIKNLDGTKNVLKGEENIISNYLFDTFKLAQVINLDNNLKMFISEISLFIINTIGFYLFYKNRLTLTNLITFNTLLLYFLEPIKSIVASIPRYNFIKVGIAKINEFLSLEKEDRGQTNKLINNDIKIKDLSFSYNNYSLILNNLNYNIANNDFVLLKGNSGTGKSTLCKIILKYLNDYKGSILIGGVNIKDYSINTLRNNIIYVSQSETLFTGTIKENILFYRNIKDEKLKEVCQLCYIDELVNNKPFRYETMINNDTSFISGGEKQRIILARALLQEGNIYLIDEALSEVDYNLEKKIILNLQKYLQNKTVIYITHKKQEVLFSKIMELA